MPKKLEMNSTRRKFRTINYQALNGRIGFCIAPTSELYEKIAKEAERTKRSKGWLIEELLSEALNVRLRLKKFEHMLPPWGEKL